MSRLKATYLRNESASVDNIVLNSDGSVGGELGTTLAAKSDYAMPKNAQTGTAYTFALTDASKLVTASNAAATTYTVPPQSFVAWAADTILRVTNLGAGAVTFAGGSGVTVTNTAATLAQYQSANLIRTASDAWTVVPFSGGASYLTAADITATTGSPTIGNYTGAGGINYTYYKWTTTESSNSITFGKIGLFDLLLVGGGGGGSSHSDQYHGAGGAGGCLYLPDLYLTASGTFPITVGAGGAGGDFGAMGGNTLIVLSDRTFTAVGGGAGYPNAVGTPGGSGGNGGYGAGWGIPGQGYSASGSRGGGAGAGGANSGNTGGIGRAISITGSSITYSTGGTRETSGAPTPNSGNGGHSIANIGSAGGSGVAIIRVRT